jgi:hypothetical protein
MLGFVTIREGSQIVIGSSKCGWSTVLTPPGLFKRNSNLNSTNVGGKCTSRLAWSGLVSPC